MLFLFLSKYSLRHKKSNVENQAQTACELIITTSTPSPSRSRFLLWITENQTPQCLLSFYPHFHFKHQLTKTFCTGKKKKSTFPRGFFFFPVDCYFLAPIISNCFTAEPKHHSQQNHSLSIRKQSERLDAKEQRWDRHQPNRTRRNMPPVLLSSGSLAGQNVNLW